MFQQSDAPAFDSTNHTQAGHKHLLQHLWDLYVAHMKETIEARKQKGERVLSIERAVHVAPAMNFVEWAAAYLLENRYAENFYVDENIGLRLTNDDHVVLCPGIATIQGSMQDANAIEVTTGEDKKSPKGIVDTHSALQII